MDHFLGQDTVVEVTDDEKPISWHMQQKINDREENAFVIGDLGDIIKKHKLWTRWLPRIKPFYAMKCNDIYPVIKLMADMGLSFDCASQSEIERILQLGVDPSRIIFANPCKQKSFIRYAAKSDVMLMTFDNKDELLKIKQYHPSSRLLLRIQAPAHFKVQHDHSKKFGCSLKHAYNLLQVARTLELHVVGVSFHVGSGCKELGVFRSAIFHAREIFNMGLNIGFHFDILDIGGGFPGDKKLNLKFEDIAEEVNISLDKHFPGDDVKIIAEPGHFYVASAFTIATNIIARRFVDSYDQDDEYNDYGHDLDINGSNEIYQDKYIMYYVNDGIYGSFRDALITPDFVSPSILKEDPIGTLHASTIWGPTCDGLDCIIKECRLPTLEIGEWIYFKDMGAYTISISSSFNGMPKPEQYFVCSRDQWKEVYPDDRHIVNYLSANTNGY